MLVTVSTFDEIESVFSAGCRIADDLAIREDDLPGRRRIERQIAAARQGAIGEVVTFDLHHEDMPTFRILCREGLAMRTGSNG